MSEQEDARNVARLINELDPKRREELIGRLVLLVMDEWGCDEDGLFEWIGDAAHHSWSEL